MILIAQYSEPARLKWFDWIQKTGISISWEYRTQWGKNYVVFSFKDEQDAVAFKLKFGL